MKYFAADVEARRLYLGWTVRQLAEKAGMRQQTVNAIESGDSNPSLDEALRIARALGVTLDFLCSCYYLERTNG